MLLLWKGLSDSEISYMRRQLDEMDLLLKKHNIYVPASTRKDDYEEEDQEYQRKGYALKDCYTSVHVFLIDSGASNHMAASRESFSYFQSFDGPSIQMGNNSKVQAKGKGLNMESSKMCFMCPP